MKTLGQTRWAVPAILLAALLVNLPSLRFGFVFDEQLLISRNPAVHHLSRFDLIFGRKFWPGPAAGIYYRPLVTLSYAVGYAMAGESPAVHHLYNILFHGLAVVLIYFLLRRLTERPATAVLTGLIFAVHPVHVESVVWIPGRTDVLATLFLSGAWLLVWKARERPAGSAVWLYLTAAALYVCALGSKETAIILVPLVVLHDLLLKKGGGGGRRLAEYTGGVLITGGFLLLRGFILAGPGPESAPPALAGLSLFKRLAAMDLIFVRALRYLLLPGPWRIDYAHAQAILNTPAWLILVSLLLTAVILASLVLAWSRCPLVVFSCLGLVLSLLPVSHLIPFPTLFAERFLYLPSLFIALLLGSLGETLREDSHSIRRWRVPAVAAWLVVWGGWSCVRALPFRNESAFWQSAVRQAPDLAVARNWLGIAYRNQGRLAEAELQYEKAIKLDPAFHVARMNLAEIFLRRGEAEKAQELIQTLLQETAEDPTLRANLAVAYARQEQWEAAKHEAEAALALDAENLTAHLLLAQYHLRVSRNRSAAQVHLQAVSELQPRHPLLPRLQRELDTMPHP